MNHRNGLCHIILKMKHFWQLPVLLTDKAPNFTLFPSLKDHWWFAAPSWGQCIGARCRRGFYTIWTCSSCVSFCALWLSYLIALSFLSGSPFFSTSQQVQYILSRFSGRKKDISKFHAKRFFLSKNIKFLNWKVKTENAFLLTGFLSTFISEQEVTLGQPAVSFSRLFQRQLASNNVRRIQPELQTR